MRSTKQRHLLGEPVFHVVVVYHFFLERVGTCFFALHHFHHFGEVLTCTSLQTCYRLLCHDLLDFFMNRHATENGVVLLELNTLRSVLTVLGGHVS